MLTQKRKTTVTFAHSFPLDGFERVLPAGLYSVESEDDVSDGMFLPDCLRTSVLIHLHSTLDSPGYSETLTVPWTALEAALSHDSWPVTPSVTEAGLEAMLLDPIIRSLMHSDHVSEASIRTLISRLHERRHADAIAA